MSEQQLSIRSTKARALAHKLAKKQRRTVSQIVELALEHYAVSNSDRTGESDHSFWARIAAESREVGGVDFDVDAILRDNHKPPRPITF